MDNLNISPEHAQALQNLSDNEKRDLERTILGEAQRAQVQGTVQMLTDVCFKKCVTGKISSGQLDRNEAPCMQNCVDRWMDANLTVIRHLESMRAQHQHM